MSIKQPTLNRRGFLSAAVALGTLATLASVVSPSGKAYAKSLDAFYGEAVDTQTFPDGRGIIKTYKDVFTGANVVETSYFISPDGRMKLAYSVVGLANQFQIVDAETGKNEYVATPPSVKNDVITGIGWNETDGCVYSVTAGEISRFNPATKEFKNLGKITPVSTAGFGPTFDSAGNGWFGSYPDAGVARVTPFNGAKTSYPNIDSSATYTRTVAVIGDTVYCGTGSVSPKIISFPVSNPSLKKNIPVPGIASTDFVKLHASAGKLFVHFKDTTQKDKTAVYDPATGVWASLKYTPRYWHTTSLPQDPWVYYAAKVSTTVSTKSLVRWNVQTGVSEVIMAAPADPMAISMRKTASGDTLYMTGEDYASGKLHTYCISIPTKKVLSSVPVGVVSAPYYAQDFIVSADGKIYVGGFQGDGIATVDTVTDARWRSPKNDPIHQIEGLIEYGEDRIYIGSYGSADLIRFNKADGSSKLIQRLKTGYMQSRPFAWALAGGKVIAGTVPEYGLRGGALAIINPATDTVEKVLNKYIPEQSIVGLVGSGDIVYGTTSVKGGNGIPDDTSPATVFAYNVATGVQLWKNTSLVHETEINSPIVVKGRLFVGVANGVIELDINTGNAIRTWKLSSWTTTPRWRNIRLRYHAQTNRIIHFSGGVVTAIGLNNNSRSLLYRGTSGTIQMSPAGKIYAITGGGRDISEIDAVYAPSIASTADIAAISPAGGVLLRRSNGAGGYTSPFVIVASGYSDAKSVHIADWNGNGIYDLVSNHTDGSLRVRYGKATGGFEAPIVVSSSGWANRRITVGRWDTTTLRPAVLSIDGIGIMYSWQVSPTFTLEAPQKLGSGWKVTEFAILDKDYNNSPGLLIREGVGMFWYPKASVMTQASARSTVKASGMGSVTQFSVVNKHRGTYNGIVWHDTTGTMRYMSNVAGTLGGILNYGTTWSDHKLGGASL